MGTNSASIDTSLFVPSAMSSLLHICVMYVHMYGSFFDGFSWALGVCEVVRISCSSKVVRLSLLMWPV